MKNLSNKMHDLASSTKKGPFVINLKNYLEIAGANTIKIVKDAEKVSQILNVEIIISPPQPYLALIIKQTNLKDHFSTHRYKKTRIYHGLLYC